MNGSEQSRDDAVVVSSLVVGLAPTSAAVALTVSTGEALSMVHELRASSDPRLRELADRVWLALLAWWGRGR